ncbi:MAG: hypothetical protein ABIG39_04965, partial [Candidatus Micrarchaeota archaeon]
YCKNGRTRAYQGADCRITEFPCGAYFCCVNGLCKKDMSNSCRDPSISIIAGAQNVMAKTKGPLLQGQFLFIFSVVALIGLAVYAFIHTEVKF